MRRLLASSDSIKIGLLKSRLEAAGIRCETRNENLNQTAAGLPFEMELWIVDDDDFAEASELLSAASRPASSGEADGR